MAKKTHRSRYYELNDGTIVEGGSYEELLINKDGSNVRRAFLAYLSDPNSTKNNVVDKYGHRWQFQDIEELSLVDGKFVTQKQASVVERTVTDQSGRTRVVGNSEEAFSMDIPDLEGFIRELDMFNENVNKALRVALHEAGNVICQAQRQMISWKSRRLSEAISTSGIYTTKSGALGITSGYQDDAFDEDDDGFNPGLVGMVTEFGRPGESPQRSDPETYRRVKGKTYKVKKGTIQPYPHIRRGFDAAKDRAAQVLINAYNAEIDKLGGGEQ